jgi:hypothetical protein
MATKRGRPSKSGDRYKCGKLRPAETSKQAISPALWQRIKTNGQKIGLDPRLAALQEGDVVLVRMVVRKPLGEHGTVHCRIHDEKTWRSHYVPVFPEHIVGRDAGDT